jgi:hypothetical protein
MVLISFCWLQEFVDAHHLPENQNNSMKNPRQDEQSTKLVGQTTFSEKEVAIGEVAVPSLLVLLFPSPFPSS